MTEYIYIYIFTFANFLAFSQPALPDPPPVSPFLDARSLHISKTPAEQYPLLHHILGVICHLIFAVFPHHHCKSPTIIFLLLHYSSPLVLSIWNLSVIFSRTHNLTHPISRVSVHALNDTRILWPLATRHEPLIDYHLDNPSDLT